MLNSTNGYTFLGVTQVKKKDDTGFWNFARLGDNAKFESYDFILPVGTTVNVDGLVKGDLVDAQFDLGLYNGRPSITLVALQKSKVLAASK